MITDSKLGILAKAGDGDTQDLVAEVQASRKLFRTMYDELSGNSNYVEKRMIEAHAQECGFNLKPDSAPVYGKPY